ncbi:glycosyltransferase family 52 [Acinetobacter indicus]|uniref:glycosyltransferase family 52 n=1 Tax=Acinetobacter indicus TaxID=756892 RepID=UPI001444948E|nr:glycosyltransferase family 52 [Acinetobacter indicus]
MINDLVICQTPFQLVLARSIMAERSDYELLIVCEKETNLYKLDYYISFFRINKIKINIMEINNGGCGSLKSLLMMRKYIKEKLKQSYTNIYLAGIHNLYIHKIISVLRFNNIITFDDGVGNINKSGVFFLEKKSFKNKLIRFIFNIKFDIDLIKIKTKRHYTIYNNVDNIVENCKFINLFSDKENNLKPSFCGKEFSIFIGQPLEHINTNITYTDLENFLRIKEVNLYYPHPRETYNLNYNKVDSLLIAEEYIINFIRENPTVKLKIYGFFSSVIFNIISINSIDVYVLTDDFMIKDYSLLYSMLNDMGGILINIKDVS